MARACDYPGPPPGSGEARAEGRGIVWAAFSDATDRYPHGVLGDVMEAAGLRARAGLLGPCALAIVLDKSAVFEDVAPRIADINGDGLNDIVVVETDVTRGASLAVYGLQNERLVKIAATPNIGRAQRWLAPVGIADFNGDGVMDIAYVETPHLGKRLRVWTWRAGALVEIARADGLTNHRIGEDFISGGVRDCGQGPEMVTADAGWNRIMVTRFEGAALVSKDSGPLRGVDSFAAAMRCAN